MLRKSSRHEIVHPRDKDAVIDVIRPKGEIFRADLACRRFRDHKGCEHGVLALYKRKQSYKTGWTETLAAMQRSR